MTNFHEAVNGVESINETNNMELSNDVDGQTSVDVAVNVANIQYSEVFRCREKENTDGIDQYTRRFMDYKEAKERGETPDYPFPRIQVWVSDPQQPEDYVLLGGHHRLEAARRAGQDTIQATVFHGSEDDAFVIAMKDNNGHGLQMTRGDLRQCIEKATSRWKDQSPGVIADQFGWSRSYVSEIMNEVSAGGQVEMPEKRQGKDGKWYPIKRKPKTKKQSRIEEVSGSGKVPEQVKEIPEETVNDPLLLQLENVPLDSSDADQEVELEKLEEECMAEFIASFDTFRQTLTGRNRDYVFYQMVIDWLRSKKKDDMFKTHEIDTQTNSHHKTELCTSTPFLAQSVA